MKNTASVVLALAVLPFLSSTVEAQQPGKVYRVGLLTLGSSAHRATIMQFAMRNRPPTMYPEGREGLIETGALLSYFTNWLDLRRRAAVFVDKILRGAKPGDLPVEEPTKFQLIVNLKAAAALGLVVPQSLLIQGDDVIR